MLINEQNLLYSSTLDKLGLSFVCNAPNIFEKMLHQIFLREMKLIQKSAEDKRIPILFFKGIIEEKEEYEKRGLFRPQHDIDILVDEDDLVDFILLCKQIGYDTSFVDLTIFKSEIDLGNQHLPMITKSVFNHYFSIGLEIHCSLGPNAFSVIPADDILKNRTLSTQPPHFYSMDIYDRIIFNLCHFSRHYLSEMLDYYYCPDNQLLQCKSLLDVYFLIKRQYAKLDWEQLVQRIDRFKVGSYTSFGLKVLLQFFEFSSDERAHLSSACNEHNDGKIFADRVLAYSCYNAGLLNGPLMDFYKSVILQAQKSNKKIEIALGKKCSLALKMVNEVFNLIEMNITYQNWGLIFSLPYRKNAKSMVLNFDQINFVNIRLYNPSFSHQEDNAVRNIFVDIHSIYNGCYEVTFNGSEPSLKGTINASKYGIKARNIEKERRLEVILPFKGLFIHNNINGFGLEIYVGVNGGLYYWSNGSKPYHNPARFGYVALHP